MLVVVDLVLVLILVVVVRVRILLVVGSGASAGRGIAWRGATINCSRAYGSRAFSAQYLAHALQAVPSFIRRAATGACVCVWLCVRAHACVRMARCSSVAGAAQLARALPSHRSSRFTLMVARGRCVYACVCGCVCAPQA